MTVMGDQIATIGTAHPITGFKQMTSPDTETNSFAANPAARQWAEKQRAILDRRTMRKAGNSPLADEIKAMTTGKASQ